MAIVKILIEGYARKLNNGWVASSTVCLIKSNGKKIITDPGCNRTRLIEVLEKEKLKTVDIDYVFLSHSHPDHIALAGIFENAQLVTYDSGLMYDNDTLTEYSPHSLGSEIEIIQTPGHLLEHISLIVNTDEGKVGIAGDVIWWLDAEKQEFRIDQPDHSHAKGMNMDTLIESRKKLIKLSDFIIPGHGQKFRVKKS